MFVLDASVAIKWFLVEPETQSALGIARAVLRGDGPFFVPELFYYEVLSVTAKKTANAHRLTPLRMRWLANLPLRRTALTREIVDEMMPFIEIGLTGYDAAYAALAKLTSSRWISYDEKARAKLGNPIWIVKAI
jgi:predicted nucleic acid-binding protein